jgi:hypothetical protein
VALHGFARRRANDAEHGVLRQLSDTDVIRERGSARVEAGDLVTRQVRRHERRTRQDLVGFTHVRGVDAQFLECHPVVSEITAAAAHQGRAFSQQGKAVRHVTGNATSMPHEGIEEEADGEDVHLAGDNVILE